MQSQFINSSIDEDMYLNFAISSCFDEISRSFKTLEFGVYKNKGGNYIKSNSQVAKRVARTIKRPNQFTSFSGIIDSYLVGIYYNGNCLFRRIKGTMSDDLYVYNNSFFEIQRNERNLTIEAIITNSVKFTGDELDDFKLVTEFNNRSQIQGIDNGVPKIKCLEPIKKLLNGSLAYSISIMKNAGSLGGFLNFNESAQDVTENTKQLTREAFKREFTGIDNAGKTMLTWGGANYQPIGTTPKDLDYINSIKELQKIVCRKMGVPETLIIGDNSSYNNTIEFKKKLYTELIIPLAKEFCEHLTELFRRELADDEEIYFSTSNIKVLQADIFNEIRDLVDSLTGVCTVNNIIKIINDKYQLELEELGEIGETVLTKFNYTLDDVASKLSFDDEPNKVEDSDE